MKKKVLGGAVLLLAIAAAWMVWQGRAPTVPTATLARTTTTAAPAQPAAPAAPAAAASGIRHPIDVAAEREPQAPTDLESALVELFGRKAVLSMFRLDDFARRFVATVDNLPTGSAPSHLWPVNPASGRFTVVNREGGTVVSADNSLRYTPLVLLVESVDMAAAVAVYRRLYPHFQQAYEALGYPGRYFNDRLVEVIDGLLTTPDIRTSAKVHLPAINGPLQPTRPWVLYEFDDPALESLGAGQKILLRMGPVNERRMKAELTEVRHLLTNPETER